MQTVTPSTDSTELTVSHQAVTYSEEYLQSKSPVCEKAHKVYQIISAAHDLAETITAAQGGSRQWLRPLTPKESDATFAARAVRALPHPVFSETVDPSVGRFLRTFDVDYTELVGKHNGFSQVLDHPRSPDDTFSAFFKDLLKSYFKWGSAPWMIDYPDYELTGTEGYTPVSGGDRYVSLAVKKALNLRPYIRILDPCTITEVTTGAAMVGSEVPPIRRLKVCVEYSTYLDPDNEELGERLLTVTEVYIYTDRHNVLLRQVTGRDANDNPNRGSRPTFVEVKQVPAYTQCRSLGVLAGSFCTDAFDSSGMIGRPPYWELALIQMGLLNSEATNGYYVDISQVPLLFGCGLSDAERPKDVIVDGPGIPLITTHLPGADLRFVELSGTSAEIGANYINRLVKWSESIAGQTFSGQAGGKSDSTATSQVLANADTTYFNVALAPALEKALNHMVRQIAALLGIVDDNLPTIRVVSKDSGAGTATTEKTSDSLAVSPVVSSVSGFIESVETKAGVVTHG